MRQHELIVDNLKLWKVGCTSKIQHLKHRNIPHFVDCPLHAKNTEIMVILDAFYGLKTLDLFEKSAKENERIV